MLRIRYLVLTAILLLCSLSFLSGTARSREPNVQKLVLNKQLQPPAKYGLARLEAVLNRRGESLTSEKRDRVLTVGTYVGSNQIKKWVESGELELEANTECLAVKRIKQDGVEQLVLAGYDSKGLMYALLDIADRLENQSTASEWFTEVKDVSESPRNQMRRIRILRHHDANEKGWYESKEYWDWYIGMLATNRFNGLNIVHSHQTPYLAPMYVWYVHVKEFPKVRGIGVSESQRKKNLDLLRYISDTCQSRGIDLTIGIWQHYPWKTTYLKTRPDQESYIEGLEPKDLGPYTYLALKELFKECPGIRRIQIRCNDESGIPISEQASFYGNYVMKAVKEAEPKVSVDIRLPKRSTIDEAIKHGLDYRISSKYYGEFMGMPHTPQDVVTLGYSYATRFVKPYTAPIFNENWMLGSHRVLLWGSEDYGRRFGKRASFDDIAIGFDTDGPLAQKGYQEPYTPEWRIFANREDEHFTHEIERYWAFFRSIGRFSYNPETDREVWMRPFHFRFGDAAKPMADAYESASQVVGLIVASHMADANMRVWPEVNMGGISSAFLDIRGIDKGLFPSINDAVREELAGKRTGRPGPLGLAQLYESIADECEAALKRAEGKTHNKSKEYEATVRDFRILINLARFNAARQREGYHMARFNFTSDGHSLNLAEHWARRSIDYWKKIVEVGNRSYYQKMLFGPTERGHWSDRMDLLETNLQVILEAKKTLYRYGVFDMGFDFGDASKTKRVRAFGAHHYLNHHFDAPRFVSQSPESLYHPDLGYGFVKPKGLQSRRPVSVAHYKLTGEEPPPKGDIPIDLLGCDYVEGNTSLRFRIDFKMDTYQFTYLFADQSKSPKAHGPMDLLEVRRRNHKPMHKKIRVPVGESVHRILTHDLRGSWYPCFEFILNPSSEDGGVMISALTVHRLAANLAHAPSPRLDPTRPIALSATITMPPVQSKGGESVSASSAGRLTSSTIRYRTLPDGEFRTKPLHSKDGFVYSSQFAAGELTGNWLEYSFHASDENGRQSQCPSMNKPSLFRVPLSVDSSPPVVQHTAVHHWQLGKSLPIEATATDDSGVLEVRVYYRVMDQAKPYECLSLERRGDRYVGSIPAEAFHASRDFVYYLEAIDQVGNGCIFPDWKTDQPFYFVKVQDASK